MIARFEKSVSGPSTAKLRAKRYMLDGIRTRNPQIRSLVRYPLRHEHLIVMRPLGRRG